MTSEPICHVEMTPCKNFLKPSSWDLKRDQINEWVLNTNNIISILAQPLGGKTTFLNWLILNLDKKIKPLLLKAPAPLNESSFLGLINKALQFSNPALNLSDLMSRMRDLDGPIFILLDEVEIDDEQWLKELIELISQQESTNFHLGLVSDYSLMETIDKMGDKSNLIQRLELPCLTETETKSYLLSTLQSPKRLDQTMSKKRLEQFYQLTGGNIARINQEMDVFFSLSPLQSLHHNRTKLIPCLKILFLLIFIGFSGFSIWKYRQPQPTQAIFLPGERQHSVSDMVTANGSQETNLTNRVYKSSAKILTSYISSLYIGAIRKEVQPSPLNELVNSTSEEDHSDLVVMDKVVIIPKILESVPSAVQQMNERIALSSKESSKLAQAISKPILQKTTIKKEMTPVIHKSIKTMKSGSSSRYTVQLVASSRLQDLHRFVKNHQLKNTIILKVNKKGKTWYVLTKGNYLNSRQAHQSLHQLPMSVSHFRPWVRSMAGLTPIG